VDKGPEHQLNLSREALELLIGKEAALRLWGLPRTYRMRTAVVLPGAAVGADADPDPEAEAEAVTEAAGGTLREMFVRRYSTQTRPWIPFHADAYEVTVNIALSADDAHSGGDLLGVFEGKVHQRLDAEYQEQI
jgi:hypothetical protein